MSITIEDPCGAIGPTTVAVLPGFPSLAGKRIGVLDNGKPNAGLLLSTMAAGLAARAGAGVTLEIAKRTAAEPCEPDLIARLAAAADVVLTGSADCGSCTTWSIHDVSTLEAAGVRAIGVTTTAFEPIARDVARTLGLVDARIAVVPHPLGGIDDDAVRALATGAVEQLVQLASG